MTNAISRTQFLRGDFKGQRVVIRPPWAHEEHRFIDVCTRCGECLKACPEKILHKGRGGFPEVDFNYGECTFCRECVACCIPGALSAENELPWRIKVEISDRCLAWQNVICVTCAEHCENRAIQFSARVGGVAQPELDADTCTGCGACCQPCPSDAIVFSHLTNHNQPSQQMEAFP